MLVLYLFVSEAVRAVWRDVRQSAPATGASPAPAKLEIVNPARTRLVAGDIIPVHAGASVGREPDNDLVVDEDTVSGRHVRFLLHEGRWWIEDLGSTNGTLVNDRHLQGSRALTSGDLIQIGRLSFRFAA
ncbi:MAG: FHA domain-containing protein [Dehalococcoidia bacterium]